MSLVADIFDVLLIDDSGNMLASSTLSTADIDIKVDSKDVNAGRADALISILHSKRDVSIKLSEVEFKWDWIAKQLGQTAVTGAATAWALSKWYTAVSATGIKITLDQLPLTSIAASGIQIYTSAGVLIPSANYTLATNVITFTSGVAAGDKVEVRGYKYTTSASASTITIDNVTFTDGCIMVLETLEIDEDETKLSRVQYQFDEVLLSGNLMISTKKERDANVTNIELRAVKPRTSDTIGKIIKIPYA